MTAQPSARGPSWHPGGALLDWILEHGHTQAWLARELGVSLKHVNAITRGKAIWSEELALRLGEVTDLPADHWNALRAEYRLREAARKMADGTHAKLAARRAAAHKATAKRKAAARQAAAMKAAAAAEGNPEEPA